MRSLRSLRLKQKSTEVFRLIRRATSWRRTTRRRRTSAHLGECRRTRSSPRSSTTAPPSGQRKTACRGGVSRAGAHTRTKASSFLRPARARTRASTASALTATTGPLRRIRAIRASRGASTSIRTTSAGTTTTAASGGPSVPSGTPTSARPARGRGDGRDGARPSRFVCGRAPSRPLPLVVLVGYLTLLS